MSIRILALTGLLALSSAGYGSAAASQGNRALPDNQVLLVTDAKEYMARINNTLELASKGEYGQLKRGSESKMRAARDRIAELLHGHATTTEVQGEDRVALVNAEEVIKSVIRNDDKDRIVCTHVAGTGSRLAKKECMSIAEREERARAARTLAKEQQQSSWGGVAQ